MKRTTIGDVAAAAGVSVATVSRVLNGGNVKEATAGRVWEAANRLEYTPNALTKSIFAGRSTTIGVVVRDLASPFYLDMMRGIDEIAAADNALVMFANAFRRVDREIAQVRMMDEQRVRGLVVTTGAATDDRTRRMAERGTPCVVMARSIPAPPPRLHTVALDDLAAGRLMAAHAVSCGRRSVAVLASGARPSQLARIEGLRGGLAEAGAALPEHAVASAAVPADVDGAVATLLERVHAVDLLVCLTGRLTVAAHTALTVRDIDIPADIGLLAMDDFPWAPTLGITVIAQPPYEMGRRAAELIIENPDRSVRTIFEPELVARASCGERSTGDAAL
ncbi:LacI family DNA-binding transcriptional regulator [Nocardia bovistercoris]|uniref:LacI family DNA-binding transcriptional regulator n=1 Tax=Nocardia bovistercoris TaxID=2785916 RepID=A0A931N4V6_9NOCA|nr:LacI family DNA-binding transcriptional regulator [Nocardia bovistercoris]MBH0779239.1 LacI family DNA-binding transcriptional regulator [Nocardia bovistercoris]